MVKNVNVSTKVNFQAANTKVLGQGHEVIGDLVARLEVTVEDDSDSLSDQGGGHRIE